MIEIHRQPRQKKAPAALEKSCCLFQYILRFKCHTNSKDLWTLWLFLFTLPHVFKGKPTNAGWDDGDIHNREKLKYMDFLEQALI